MSTPACKLVNGLWVGPYITGTHSSLHNRKQQKAVFPSYLGLWRGAIMDNKGEEAALCGLAGLTGAVEGVFVRKLAWRISPAKYSMVKSRVSGHSAFLQLHREV